MTIKNSSLRGSDERTPQPATAPAGDVHEAQAIKLFAIIKKTSKYAYQNEKDQRTGKLVPQEVTHIGNGNFGPDTVFTEFNQYPIRDLAFYVESAWGRYVKLGG